MKKRRAAAWLISLLLYCTGCGAEAPPELVLSRRAYTLTEGGGMRLAAEGYDSARLRWISSDPRVACVVEGDVDAVAPGMAVITAVAPDGRQDVCTVTVRPQVSYVPCDELLPGEPSVFTYRKNAVGGVTVRWAHRYAGDRPVVCCIIHYRMLNGAGEPVCDMLSGRERGVMRVAGWVAPGQSLIWHDRKPSLYCPALRRLVIDEVVLVYADGSREGCLCRWQSAGHE